MNSKIASLILSLCFILLLAQNSHAQQPTPEPETIFEDVTQTAGFTTEHHDLYMITGQAWGDVNNDGWLDLYLTDSGGPNYMYLNQGDGSFKLAPYTGSLALWEDKSSGAIFADYDNDGWSDLYVVSWEADRLFHNNQGVSFTDVTRFAGLGDENAGKSASWGDYDEDGYLDLYVANWSCTPDCGRPMTGDADRLYHNNGDGSFSDVSPLLGSQTNGAGFVATFTDYDNDGDLDIYLVNDEFVHPIGNKLWRNDGVGCDGWCFTEVATEAGADQRVMGMGLATGDYDNDGDMDFYFSNAGKMVLLQNQGTGSFINVAAEAGVELDLGAIGWGSLFFDYDHDGWQDLYLAITQHNQAGGAYNKLFHNRGDGTFDLVTNSGADDPRKSMGVAYADYDNDGWIDLVVGNAGEGYALYHNRGMAGVENGWLTLRLQGGGGINRDAVGSRVYVTTNDGRVQMQEVINGSGLGGGSSLSLHFGLGGATLQSVKVVWANGLEQIVPNLQANQRYLVEYAGKPAIWLDQPLPEATPQPTPSPDNRQLLNNIDWGELIAILVLIAIGLGMIWRLLRKPAGKKK